MLTWFSPDHGERPSRLEEGRGGGGEAMTPEREAEIRILAVDSDGSFTRNKKAIRDLLDALDAERQRAEEAEDKAIRFDLDEAGIAKREADAVELVEARAERDAARQEADRLREALEAIRDGTLDDPCTMACDAPVAAAEALHRAPHAGEAGGEEGE